MALTTKHMHRSYLKDGGRMGHKKYRKVLKAFNRRVMNHLIGGHSFDMGSYLSRMGIIRLERDFSKPQINWGATNKNKKRLLEEEGYTEEDLYSKDNPDGIKYFIYFTDDWYCRFYWQKKDCKVRNKSAYAFRATRGKKGNKTKLKNRLKEDDLAYLDYKLVKND